MQEVTSQRRWPIKMLHGGFLAFVHRAAVLLPVALGGNNALLSQFGVTETVERPTKGTEAVFIIYKHNP